MIVHRNKVAFTCPSCERPFAVDRAFAMSSTAQCPHCQHKFNTTRQLEDFEFFNAAWKQKQKKETK